MSVLIAKLSLFCAGHVSELLSFGLLFQSYSELHSAFYFALPRTNAADVWGFYMGENTPQQLYKVIRYWIKII